MSPIRRSFAALLALLLMQLMLLGSGTLCAMHHERGSSMASDARIAHDHAGHSQLHESHPAPVANETAEQPAPGGPWSPGHCASMAACDVGTALVPSVETPAPILRVALVVRSSAAAPAGPTFAPELPPPRA